MTSALTVEFVAGLYREFAQQLKAVRAEQRRLYAQRSDARLERYAPYRWTAGALRRAGLPAHYKRRFRPKFDDVESEITYLLVRHVRPAVVLEVAPYYGWSTTWLLQALRDNGTGRLVSYDLMDYCRWTVPAPLAEGRWRFTQGDVRRHLDALPPDIGYLFIDAAHTADFARWYIDHLFPRLAPGTIVGVHDIFRGPALPAMPERAVLLEWLARRGIPCMTAAPSEGSGFARLQTVKRELDLAEPIHDSIKNPMAFFRLPS